MKKNFKLTLSEKKLVQRNLDLAEHFLLEVIKNPKRLEGIPSGSTIVLYPVTAKHADWRWSSLRI
ncbi:MAG: hypothetical protein HY747_08310 [Elusimicrobia bacterium]|nr:hypothetical protein [Elusimicrobiota bacterium]